MKKDTLLKSMSLFSLATMVSRVLGLVRDMFIASCIPAMWQDIFWAGFKIPSTFRMLFAEGALSAVFIPMLTRVREREGEAEAREYSAAIFHLLLLSVCVVSVLAILLAPFFIHHFFDFKASAVVTQMDANALGVPNLYPDQPDWRYAAGVRAAQIMFPFLVFVALAAWAMGILNSYNYFFMPALASAFFNIVLIAGCILGPYYYQNMGLIEFMGIVVVLGGIAQFVVQLPQARHIQFFPPHRVSPFHPRVKEFLIKMAPGVFGLAVYQINALITQMYFASKWDGGISIMTYAFRFIQLPLGVVGVALAAASFPRISQQIEQDRHADAAKTLMKVLKYLMVLMIPASVGLMVLGKDIIGLIYNRMEFQKANWLEPTYMVMIFYAFGLFFYSLLKVLVRVIQAHHDFTTPVKIGTVSLVVNIVLCSLFSRFLPLWSLALASALASAVQGALLLVVVVRRMPDFSLSRVLAFSVRVLVAVGGMGLVCVAFVQYCPVEGGTTMSHLFRVVVGMGGGMVVYAGLGWILFRQEMESVLKLK